MSKLDEYGLTPKQRLFCEYYLTNGFHATNAYKKAYPDNKNPAYNSSAFKTLENPRVYKYINDSINKMAEDLHITAPLIMKQLQSIAMDETAYPKDRLKALELIQKQMGLQNQKITLESLDNFNFNVTLTDDTEESDNNTDDS